MTQTTSPTATTTLPDVSGWYRGTLHMGSDCLEFTNWRDDPSAYPAPPFEATIHVVGFAPDASAHYTLDATGSWVGGACVGGWDTGAPADLTEPDDDPDCLGCNRKYFGAWPPAECNGGGEWVVIAPSGSGIAAHFYFGVPWSCHTDFHGSLLPIPPPN